MNVDESKIINNSDLVHRRDTFRDKFHYRDTQRRFSLDSHRLLPLKNERQAWLISAKSNRSQYDEPATTETSEKQVTPTFKLSKYKTLPAIGNASSDEQFDEQWLTPSELFEHLFDPNAPFDNSDPVFTKLPALIKSPLVRTTTYDVLHPIIVDECEDDATDLPQKPHSSPPTLKTSTELVLIIKLPDGQKIYGYFKKNDTLSDVLQYCQTQSGKTFENCQLIISNVVVEDLLQPLSDVDINHQHCVEIKRKM